jgi:hypothetical protein
LEECFPVDKEAVGDLGRTVERDPSEDFSIREEAGTDTGQTLTATPFPFRSKYGVSKTRGLHTCFKKAKNPRRLP